MKNYHHYHQQQQSHRPTKKAKAGHHHMSAASVTTPPPPPPPPSSSSLVITPAASSSSSPSSSSSLSTWIDWNRHRRNCYELASKDDLMMILTKTATAQTPVVVLNVSTVPEIEQMGYWDLSQFGVKVDNRLPLHPSTTKIYECGGSSSSTCPSSAIEYAVGMLGGLSNFMSNRHNVTFVVYESNPPSTFYHANPMTLQNKSRAYRAIEILQTKYGVHKIWNAGGILYLEAMGFNVGHL